MKGYIDKVSNQKQYLEKDTLVIVQDNDIVKIVVKRDDYSFINLMCKILELTDVETKVYTFMSITKQSYSSIHSLACACYDEYLITPRHFTRAINNLIHNKVLKYDPTAHENRLVINEDFVLKNLDPKLMCVKFV